MKTKSVIMISPIGFVNGNAKHGVSGPENEQVNWSFVNPIVTTETSYVFEIINSFKLIDVIDYIKNNFKAKIVKEYDIEGGSLNEIKIAFNIRVLYVEQNIFEIDIMSNDVSQYIKEVEIPVTEIKNIKVSQGNEFDNTLINQMTESGTKYGLCTRNYLIAIEEAQIIDKKENWVFYDCFHSGFYKRNLNRMYVGNVDKVNELIKFNSLKLDHRREIRGLITSHLGDALHEIKDFLQNFYIPKIIVNESDESEIVNYEIEFRVLVDTNINIPKNEPRFYQISEISSRQMLDYFTNKENKFIYTYHHEYGNNGYYSAHNAEFKFRIKIGDFAQTDIRLHGTIYSFDLGSIK